MSDIISSTDNNQSINMQSSTDNAKQSITNGTSSITSQSTTTTQSTSVSSSETTSPSSITTKPTTMPVSRYECLQQMLWHSLMEAKGEIVGVTKTNGETYSGVLFAIEPNDKTTSNGMINDNYNDNNTNAAWKYIVLKYVQKMSDPNMDPSQRMKSPFMEELKIPASDFAVLSAKGLTDHTNSYRRSDRQAFNDATGRKLHRKERELVRWDAGASLDAAELENDEDLDELRNGSYDQFKANEKYNISATFDESIYTSNLDKTDPEYTKNLKEAKLDEQRIMAQPVNNKHVADDRAYFHKHNQRYNDIDKDQDEEDAYSRVLHEASMSKVKLKNKNNNNSYVPPALRNNNHQNNKKNKGHNKGNHGRDNARRPPMNRDNRNKNKEHNNNNSNSPNRNQNVNQNVNQNQNQNQNQLENIQNQNVNSPNVNNNMNNNSVNNNQSQNQSNGVQNVNINSPNQQNNNAAILQALANQQNMLQQQQVAKLAQFTQQATQSLGGGLFAGLPPHIAQIVQTVTPQNTIQQAMGSMNQSQLAAYQQLLQNQNQNQTAQIGRPLMNENDKDEGNTLNNKDNENNDGTIEGNMNTTLKDDTGSLNPHAKAFTPQISPNQKSNQQNNQQSQQQQSNTITPSTSAQQLLTQQGQQTLLTQQLPLGQYNYNPATGQYVLNPFAQGQQQQLALLQQTQHQAYLQQLAIQQQLHLQQQQPQMANNLTNQQSDPTAQALLAQHQQQLLAHQQAQQQAQLLAQQAQANGLNIGAPLFTPSNMQQQQQVQVNTQQLNQQNMLTAQNQYQQNPNLQQQQQAALLQQQYLPFGAITQQQQQYFMGNANMQNLMQQ